MKPVPKGLRIVVTGGAGFIGSHLVEFLSAENDVVAFDNLSTGHRRNLPPTANLEVGDIQDAQALRHAFAGADLVFHLAALPSVARSVIDPLTSHEVNATGTLRVLEAARTCDVKRIVYAASSSAYGNEPGLPRREEQAPAPLSPYAVAKLTGELYMRAFAASYGLGSFCLRYFNVYGPRQDPMSPYAAVIPLFLAAALQAKPLTVHGDGKQTRDFTFVDDAVRATALAGSNGPQRGEVVNVAGGRQINLLEIVDAIGRIIGRPCQVSFGPVRLGDVRDSFADLSRAKTWLDYEPSVSLEEGLRRTLEPLRASSFAAAQRLSKA